MPSIPFKRFHFPSFLNLKQISLSSISGLSSGLLQPNGWNKNEYVFTEKYLLEILNFRQYLLFTEVKLRKKNLT